MATKSQKQNFINEIAPIIQKIAFEKGYNFPSAIIAQACLESAYGTSSLSKKYHNYFGMKCGASWNGKSVNLTTKEEYTKGNLTTIKSYFRVYDSLEDGIKGYFDFISLSRYKNLLNATSSHDYLTKIKNDGYATSKNYVENNYNVVKTYDLEKYDKPIVKESIYYPKYTGISTSIVAILDSMKIDSSYLFRKKIAQKNNIANYTGTMNQNVALIKLLKNGVCKKV